MQMLIVHRDKGRDSITSDYNASSVEATVNILHGFMTDAI